MNIAFYAPLKPPDHPHPSGDRLLARLFIEALGRAGHRVTLASTLRSFDGTGDRERQTGIRTAAEAEAQALIDTWRKGRAPDLWFSYHVYHKAPDWIGPMVSQALGMPYVIAEASVSPSRANGPWRAGHDQAVHAVSRAAAVITLNGRDIECTRPLMAPHAIAVRLAPFIDLHAWPPVKHRPVTAPVRMVAVARMRPGDKARSWGLLADWLRRLETTRWTLDVVGDGDVRTAIESHLRDVAGDRVRCHGRLEGEALAAVLDAGDLFVWPAVNEAFGMALIEAQSRGLPIVAGRNGGVPQVVAHGITGLLAGLDQPQRAASHIDHLLERPVVVERMGRAAREHVIARHGIDAASRTLDQLVRTLCAKST